MISSGLIKFRIETPFLVNENAKNTLKIFLACLEDEIIMFLGDERERERERKERKCMSTL